MIHSVRSGLFSKKSRTHFSLLMLWVYGLQSLTFSLPHPTLAANSGDAEQRQEYQDALDGAEDTKMANNVSMGIWGGTAALCGFNCFNYLFTLRKARKATLKAAESVLSAAQSGAACPNAKPVLEEIGREYQRMIELSGKADADSAKGQAIQDNGVELPGGSTGAPPVGDQSSLSIPSSPFIRNLSSLFLIDQAQAAPVGERPPPIIKTYGSDPTEYVVTHSWSEAGNRWIESAPIKKSSYTDSFSKQTGEHAAPTYSNELYPKITGNEEHQAVTFPDGKTAVTTTTKPASKAPSSTQEPMNPSAQRDSYDSLSRARDVNGKRPGEQSSQSSESESTSHEPEPQQPERPPAQASAVPENETLAAYAEAMAKNAEIAAKAGAAGAKAAANPAAPNPVAAKSCGALASSLPGAASALQATIAPLQKATSSVTTIGTFCSYTSIAAGAADAALAATLAEDMSQGMTGLIGAAPGVISLFMKKNTLPDQSASSKGINSCFSTVTSLAVVAVKAASMQGIEDSIDENKKRLDELQSFNLKHPRPLSQKALYFFSKLLDPVISCSFASSSPAAAKVCDRRVQDLGPRVSCAISKDRTLNSVLESMPGGASGFMLAYSRFVHGDPKDLVVDKPYPVLSHIKMMTAQHQEMYAPMLGLYNSAFEKARKLGGSSRLGQGMLLGQGAPPTSFLTTLGSNEGPSPESDSIRSPAALSGPAQAETRETNNEGFYNSQISLFDAVTRRYRASIPKLEKPGEVFLDF